MSLPVLHLKPGRDKSLRRRHPWVFSGAVARVTGTPNPGDTVQVAAADGSVLGLAAYSPRSQIRARMWTFDAGAEIGPQFFRDRAAAALAARDLPTGGEPYGRRLVHGENDGLPGLVVDRYGDHLVCQFLAAGPERWRDAIVAAVSEVTGCTGVHERSDADVREKEGLAQRAGHLAGVEAPERIEIVENGRRFLVDVRQGHKTGFYLDQRDARAKVAAMAGGRDVLNVFAYTGGFGVAALKAGAAQVTDLDASAPALALARRHADLNGVADRHHVLEADAFAQLREFRKQGRRFDVIVLDPPKFVESRQHLNRACRGYKDINLQAFHVLNPGGVLATFSCSGLLEPALFQKIVADAALDAGRAARLSARLDQADDHPVALAFPEGAYLKGLVCRAE